MPAPRLTTLAHELIAAHLQPGDHAVDATAGNGHDTLFLARQVGAGGRVDAFDIQPRALEHTRQRLDEAGIRSRATLHLRSHADMACVLADCQDQVAAITFNLGYLPGGDKAQITQPDSTLDALAAAAWLLRPGGVIAIVAYRGHPGGAVEYERVRAWLDAQPTGWATRVEPAAHPAGPVLLSTARPAPLAAVAPEPV